MILFPEIPVKMSWRLVFAGILAILISQTAQGEASGDSMPVTLDRIVRVDGPPGMDLEAELMTSGEGTVLIHEHASPDFSVAELRYSTLHVAKSGKITFTQPRATEPRSRLSIRTSASVVVRRDGNWLYFVEAAGLRSEAIAVRAQIENGELKRIQPLRLRAPIKAINWPEWLPLPDGRVALAYRNTEAVLIAFSDDGVVFSDPQKVSERPGSVPKIAHFPDGRIVFSFQQGPMEAKTSFVRISNPKGHKWGERILVSEGNPNVHNTMPVMRKDGLIDLYYLVPPPGWHGFALWRRCLGADGSLGNAQQVVVKEFGNLLEPAAHRLPDDRLLLTFNELRSGHHLHATVISGDAPCAL